MEIGLILAHRYPSEPEPPVNYEVLNGQITRWNTAVLGPQPTNEQLRGWWLEAEKWNRRKHIALSADLEYEKLLAPDTVMSRVERDETLEKKAANKAVAGVANLIGTEQTLSTNIDSLRAKYKAKKQDVNNVTQGTGETVEQAVTRVRNVSW